MSFAPKLSRIINQGQSRSIALTGNIYDLYHDGKNWVTLMEYLSNRYSISSKEKRRGLVVVRYAVNDNIEIIGTGKEEVYRNWSSIFEAEKPLSERIKGTNDNGTYALELMRMMAMCSRKSPNRNYDLLFIIEGSDMLLPEEELSRMSLFDRKRIAVVHSWLCDPEFVNGQDSMIMIAESRSIIHHRISRLPQVLTVEIPNPDYGTRRNFIEDNSDFIPSAKDELSSQTAGLSLHAIRQILRSGKISTDIITAKVEEYISSQLGDGVIEFVKPTHTLGDIIGFSKLKEFARKELIPRFKADGESALTGCAVGGPIGGGKTFFFEAVAAELDMPVLIMKSMRSQWFGQTDVIFERFQRAITALDKVAIFVDEADTAFGKIQGGHETERRLTGKIQAMMSDPRLRGKVIWMLMTARIHLLSPDIRRPGRVGDLIIPVLDPVGDDRIAFIDWTFKGLKVDKDRNYRHELDQVTKGYSAASFAGLRSQIKGSKCKTLDDAIKLARDLLTPDIESTRRYQTLQALLNCTRKSLLEDGDGNYLNQLEDVSIFRGKWRREIMELEKEGVE